MKKVKLIFADDHGIVRDGLRTLFRSDKTFSIAGEASNGEEAVQLASKVKPDIAILDISMPKLNGIEATKVIKSRHPDIKVLILTIHDKEDYVYELIQAGASGYVLKNAEKREIFEAVRTVAGGESYFSPGVSKPLVDGAIKRTKEQPAEPADGDGILTRREEEILRRIAEGLTSREIAAALHISFRTVNSHRTNLMQKLDIHDTAGLVRYAMQTKLVDITPKQHTAP